MNKIDKKIAVTASILAAVTIGIGAFGAHGLKNMVTDEALKVFETGVRYQMYHILALFVIGFTTHIPSKVKLLTSRFFYFGILFFSRSLYLLAIQEFVFFDASFLGPITPLGGLSFIIGWLLLAYSLLTIKEDK